MYSTIDDFILGDTLGKGFSAKVKKAFHPDGSEIALKIFQKEKPNFDERILKLAEN